MLTFFIFIAVGHNLQLVTSLSAKNYSDLPVRYPGPIKETIYKYGQDDYANDIPDQCQGENYCTIKPDNYPQEKFNKMFKGLEYQQPALVLEDFGTRQGDPDEKDDCDSNVTYDPLYKVRTTGGDWRTVVQAPEENYVQRVRLETCKSPGAKCFHNFKPPPNYTTSCKQKHNVWELLVDGVHGPEKVKAELPVCCTCTYKHVIDSKGL